MNTQAPHNPQKLDLLQLREHLLTRPASRRVSELIEHPHVRAVLRRLPAQDLLIAVHAAGVADSLELIELLPPRHVQAFVDLEAWRRDHLDPRALASWLSVLYAANPERALTQIVGLDVELVTLFLKLHTRLYDLSQDIEPEPLPDGSIHTPDGRYLITFVTPPHPEGRERPDVTDEIGTEVARKFVLGLLARQPMTAMRFLEAVKWELPSELEDACLRWRTGRLADLGFYDLYESMAVYSPVNLNQKPRTRATSIIADADDADTALSLFIDEFGDAPLLRTAVNALAPERIFGFRRQLVALCNRVVAAQALSPADLEALARAVVDVTATCNLGLEFLSKGDVKLATEYISDIALVEIFRYGYTLTWQLGQRARRVRSKMSIDKNVNLLSTETDLVLAALSKRVPRMHDTVHHSSLDDTRPFETLAQLARSAEIVAQTAFETATLTTVFGFEPALVGKLIGRHCNLMDIADIDMDIIMATSLMRFTQGGGLDPSPLEPDELETTRSLLVANSDQVEQSIVSTLCERVQVHLPVPGAASAEDAEKRARLLAQRLLKNIETDVTAIKGTLDPRLIQSLLCILGQ